MAQGNDSTVGASEHRDREFIITRVFDAPRNLVWKAWSDAERLMHWWGPTGCTVRVGTFDFRPGGVFHYCLQTPEGVEMWGIFVYREIVAPERIVFISSFSDPEGKIVRAPFSPTWPLEIANTLTLSEHDGTTTLTLRGGPHNATEAERATFDDARDSLRQGFTGTLDRLADDLATP